MGERKGGREKDNDVILQRKEKSGAMEKCMVLGMDLEGFVRQLLIIFKLSFSYSMTPHSTHCFHDFHLSLS